VNREVIHYNLQIIAVGFKVNNGRAVRFRKWSGLNRKVTGRIDILQERGFTEKDWKLFRSKIANWQEVYMDRLNKEYIALLSGGGNPSYKFWNLENRIKKDKKKTGVRAEMSRSNLIYNIISLMYEGAISFEDLEEFSDQLKETVRAFTGK